MTIDAATVGAYLKTRGAVPADAELTVEELTGGVSGTVLAVHGPGIALVVKQALPRLRVTEEWTAPARRTDTEAAALRLAAKLIPGCVPPVVDSDSREHVVVLQHAPSGWRNWQAEMLDGRAHAASGSWAGDTLGRLHSATAGDAEVAAAFADYEAFAKLRLEPYHEAVIERLPHLAAALTPLVDELRDSRVLPRARRLRTQEHPARARRRLDPRRGGRARREPGLRSRVLPRLPPAHGACRSHGSPPRAARSPPASRRPTSARARLLMPSASTIAAHTGAMVLARTDGRSPAAFLDARAVKRARKLGERLVLDPAQDLAAMVAACG